MHHNFDLNGIRIHDLQIMHSPFDVTETLALITKQSATY